LSIEKGLEIIKSKNSLLLASETGLGKTIVAATIALNANPENLLVISPKANQKAWVDIMNKSGINYTLSGNRVIPNYKTPFDFVIIDEVHKIGTVTSTTYQSIYKLVKYNQSKLISISATPYNNNIESFVDILSLFNLPQDSMEFHLIGFLSEKLFESNYELILNRRIFGTGLDKMSFRDIANNVEHEMAFYNNLTLLSQIISIFTIRDKRNSIEILPTEHLLERFPNTNVLELNVPYQNLNLDKNFYNLINKLTFAWQNQVNYFIPDLNNNFGNIYRTTLFKLMESSLSAFVASIKNSVVSIETALLKGIVTIGEKEYSMTNKFIDDLNNDLNVYSSLITICEASSGSNPKAELLFNIINESEGKFVVFTEYTETLNMLSQEAEKRKIPFIAFKSDTNESVLDVISNEFDANNHKSNKYKVLICNDVLAEGVSLHYAKHLVHYDSRWNPSRLIQREGRINRICMDGNSHDINIYKFAVPNNINYEIELTEKIERKSSEAEILLNNLNADGLNKYVSTAKNIIVQQVDANDYQDIKVIENIEIKNIISFFINENQFVSVNKDYVLPGGTYNVYPVKKYLETKAYPEQTFKNIFEYADAVNKYGKTDNRFNDNYNLFSVLWNEAKKTTRSRSKIVELLNWIRTMENKKELQILSNILTDKCKLPIKSFYFPIAFIFAEAKKEAEKEMKTIEKENVKGFIYSRLSESINELAELVIRMDDGKRKILKAHLENVE